MMPATSGGHHYIVDLFSRIGPYLILHTLCQEKVSCAHSNCPFQRNHGYFTSRITGNFNQRDEQCHSLLNTITRSADDIAFFEDHWVNGPIIVRSCHFAYQKITFAGGQLCPPWSINFHGLCFVASRQKRNNTALDLASVGFKVELCQSWIGRCNN